MNIEDLIASYGIAIVIVVIIKIIYFISLHIKVSCVVYELEDVNKRIDSINEQTIKQTELLERIAKALEQDSEPYIIENKEEDT